MPRTIPAVSLPNTVVALLARRLCMKRWRHAYADHAKNFLEQKTQKVARSARMHLANLEKMGCSTMHCNSGWRAFIAKLACWSK